MGAPFAVVADVSYPYLDKCSLSAEATLFCGPFFAFTRSWTMDLPLPLSPLFCLLSSPRQSSHKSSCRARRTCHVYVYVAPPQQRTGCAVCYFRSGRCFWVCYSGTRARRVGPWLTVNPSQRQNPQNSSQLSKCLHQMSNLKWIISGIGYDSFKLRTNTGGDDSPILPF